MKKRHKRKALSLGNVWGLPGKPFSAFERMWTRVLTDRPFPSLGVCSTALSDEGRDFNEKDSVMGQFESLFLISKAGCFLKKRNWESLRTSEVWKRTPNVLQSDSHSLIPLINLCPQSSPSKFKLIYFYLAFTPDNFKVLCFQELGVFSWIMSFSDYFKFFLLCEAQDFTKKDELTKDET